MKSGAWQKNSVQNNKSLAGVCHECSCVSNFCEIGSRKNQALDAECCVMCLCPTVSSQNSKFGKKRGDRSFYKRFVRCFCCWAQSPEICFQVKISDVIFLLRLLIMYVLLLFRRCAKDLVSSN